MASTKTTNGTPYRRRRRRRHDQSHAALDLPATSTPLFLGHGQSTPQQNVAKKNKNSLLTGQDRRRSRQPRVRPFQHSSLPTRISNSVIRFHVQQQQQQQQQHQQQRSCSIPRRHPSDPPPTVRRLALIEISLGNTTTRLAANGIIPDSCPSDSKWWNFFLCVSSLFLLISTRRENLPHRFLVDFFFTFERQRGLPMSWSSDAINYSQRLVKKYFEKKYVERSFTMFGVGGGCDRGVGTREKKTGCTSQRGGAPPTVELFFFTFFASGERMTDRKKKKNDFSPFRFSMAELPTQCVCWLHPSSKEKRKRERKREREREVSHFPPGFGGWVLLFFSFHFVSFQFFFARLSKNCPEGRCGSWRHGR